MPVKFISLSSGSNGNCYVIFNGECSVMIDAGVGIRKTKNALKAAGLSLDLRIFWAIHLLREFMITLMKIVSTLDVT